MKSRILIVASFVALSASISTCAFARQEPSSNQSIPGESAPQSTGSWPTPEEAVARMSTKLNLTDDQKSKITPIIADRQAQMRALMADTSSRRMQKARKAKSILSDSDKKIEATLTDDQKKTYEQMKDEMREKMKAHRGM